MINRQCPFPRGKGVGGSSLLNALMYVRGNRWDYDYWAELGNEEWSYERVLPYFKKSENFTKGNPVYHGHHGPVHVEYHRPYSPQFYAFLEANEELGQKIVDYNGRHQLGCAKVQANYIEGYRDDVGKAYIRPFLNRTNLHLQINSYVTKIILRNGTAVAVHFTFEGRQYVANASREIILSAGSINSPAILMHSGVGPREDLQDLDIIVYKDLPAVGRNLLDHPTFYGMNFNMDYQEPVGSVVDYVEEFLNNSGPYTIAGNNQGVGFIRTKLAQLPDDVPDVEFIVVPSNSTGAGAFSQRMYYLTNETYEAVWGGADPTRLFMIYVILLHPVSTGSVRLASSNPFDYPLIDARFLSDPENRDIDTMYEGIKYVLRLIDTEAYRKWNATLHVADLPACRSHEPLSKDYWYCFLRQFTVNVYHPMGSNRMGSDPSSSVVNSRLKVHGVEGLRVADASVFPWSVSGHTGASAMMVGEVASDLIKQDYFVV